jgi:signal transduction histidine kinase
MEPHESASSDARPITDPTGARVLVVDDDAQMRADLHRLLSAQYMVQAFADGAEALVAARARRPDLLLSDVVRPGLDGLALVRALRADPVTRTIPILLLSTRAGEEAAVAGLEAGADDYVVKPFSDRELLARVNTRIAHARMRTELAAAQERQCLAGQLHDALTQTLVGIHLVVSELMTLAGTGDTRITALLEQLQASTRAAIAETRVLLLEVRPETEWQQRLGELIEHLTQLVRARVPLDIVFERRELDPRPLPTDVQHAFYRIAQESLENVMKHAHATKLEILAEIDLTEVTLSIRDDGRGFDPQAASGGLGLGSMQARAASIGAALKITSAPGHGTEVAVRWRRT